MRPSTAFRPAILLAASLVACAHPRERLPAPATGLSGGAAAACPFGRDYGSGMVALGLPPGAHRQLVEARSAVVAEVASDIGREAVVDEPFAPHVSVVYGVTSDNRQAIAEALGAQARLAAGAELAIDGVELWAIGSGGRRALVATIGDPGGRLAALHRALQPLTGQAERYPYRPHLTLATLTGPGGLSAQTLERASRRLGLLRAHLQVAWLTDRCGLAAGYEAFGRPPGDATEPDRQARP